MWSCRTVTRSKQVTRSYRMGNGARLAIAIAQENGEHVARVLYGVDGEKPELLATAKGSLSYVLTASTLFAREWRTARELEEARSEPRLRVARPLGSPGTPRTA